MFVTKTLQSQAELDVVGGVGVVVVAAVDLGAEVDTVALGGKKGTSILLTLYCLLCAWWFLLLFLESLVFLFLGTCDFMNGDVVGLSR